MNVNMNVNNISNIPNYNNMNNINNSLSNPNPDKQNIDDQTNMKSSNKIKTKDRQE